MNALAELKKSELAIKDLVNQLSDTEFLYKSNPERWSVAEILEHVIKVENTIVQNLKQLGAAPPQSNKESTLSNEKVMELSANRAQKSKARAFGMPTGIFIDKTSAIEAFHLCRSQSEAFVKNPNFDLKAINYLHPRLGLLNGENWTFFISGHCMKHVAQIKDFFPHLV